MNPTHDWHIGTDGMELLIRRDEAHTVGVHLGHENMDDAHATRIVTSRLLEMIDTVHPGAVRAYLAAQDPTEAELDAAYAAFVAHSGPGRFINEFHESCCTECGYAVSWPHIEMDGGKRAKRHAARAALSAAQAVGRDAR